MAERYPGWPSQIREKEFNFLTGKMLYSRRRPGRKREPRRRVIEKVQAEPARGQHGGCSW